MRGGSGKPQNAAGQFPLPVLRRHSIHQRNGHHGCLVDLVSHAAVLQADGMRWPADMYLEGSDQHRGWFQSSLSTSVAAFDEAPYKSVLTHGFVVDGEGRKMSKSLGNVIGPAEVIRQYGADILRMWVASAEYRGDIRVSQEILQQLADAYRRIRNTARFILGNLSDFDPDKTRLLMQTCAKSIDGCLTN